MITDNYWRFLAAALNTPEVGGSRLVGSLVDLNGDSEQMYFGTNDSWRRQFRQDSSYNGYLFARIGTGTTAPQYTDYALNSDITAAFSDIIITVVNNVGANGLVKTISVTGNNSSSTAQTVTQIGVCKQFSSGVQSNVNTALFAVGVLDQPITVEPGLGFTVTFEWTES